MDKFTEPLHHDSLWEEEKHYTWFLSVLLASMMLVLIRMPETPQTLFYGVVVILSCLGGFVSSIAFNVINLECGYFQIAFRRHVLAENAVFSDDMNAEPSREWSSPTMWSLLKQFSGNKSLGVRGYFLATFAAFDKVFLLAAASSFVAMVYALF